MNKYKLLGNIKKCGKKISSTIFYGYYIPEVSDRCYISISRKVGKAHDRNKIRRRIIEALRLYGLNTIQMWIIVIPKGDYSWKNICEIYQNLKYKCFSS